MVFMATRCRDECSPAAGVNTGFGGSADTRTSKVKALQSALLQHHHFGVLTNLDSGLSSEHGKSIGHALPPAWVRATMLVRCNTILRGHSAVSLQVIETIVSLLQHNLIPVVPLRGSISASGDLSPLSYIAGAVTGNPDICVQTGRGSALEYVSADKALEMINVQPAVLGPKEGLGLMNGTATSAAVASLVLYEAHQLAVLAQILTAMAVEALLGSAGSFDPFIANIRPHEGQIEAALNIRVFLQGSQLAQGLKSEKKSWKYTGKLYQDRYALRTASQWLGPQLEDLLLAHSQISTELNSTTDNPLVDVAQGKIHHGGNFQAVSVTSAMEKGRMSLQMIGKLMFAQCSELINPMLSNGLPPNLAADEPSTSFGMKGVDIGMASYMSELAFLANPVSSHVQSAEMCNQAINSLALISARYTMEAVELVSLLSASYLYTVCQALDLRVMQINFFKALEPILQTDLHDALHDILCESDLDKLHRDIWIVLMENWSLTGNVDSEDRFNQVLDSCVVVLANFLVTRDDQPVTSVFSAIKTWKSRALSSLAATFLSTRSHFFESQNTIDFLGNGTRKVYVYVRKVLRVPFHKGLEDDPTSTRIAHQEGNSKRTIGSWISVIYESLRSGDLHAPVMDALLETVSTDDINIPVQIAPLNAFEENATKISAGLCGDISVKVDAIKLEDGAGSPGIDESLWVV